MLPVLVQLIRIILRFQGPLKQEFLAQTLISVMDTSYQMLVMTETFRMSSFGRSRISNIGLGRQDTHYILLTNNTYGTSGSATTDLFSVQMLKLSQLTTRTNFKVLQIWICMTARPKVIISAEFYTETNSIDNTWTRSGD